MAWKSQFRNNVDLPGYCIYIGITSILIFVTTMNFKNKLFYYIYYAL